MNGFLNVLKPSGMSSSDVVTVARKLTGQKKLGHSGTLDPLAAGVLPLCLGRATKLFDYLMEKDKIYLAELTLGAETDTQDAAGEIIARGDPTGIGMTQVAAVLANFRGRISQQPPMYSALVRDGKKLYKLARAGQTVEREHREVDILRLELVEQTGPYSFLLEVECSKGTYIRTLLADIGQALGCYGCMTFLLRTASGRFRLDETVTLEELAELSRADRVAEVLVPMDIPLEHLPRFDCPEGRGMHLLNGIPLACSLPTDTLARVYVQGIFVGLGLTSSQTETGEACRTRIRMKTTLLEWSQLPHEDLE